MVSRSSVCLSICRMSVHMSYFHPCSLTVMSKYQRIFTKVATCIDIVEMLFGIASRRISSIFLYNVETFVCPKMVRLSLFSFLDDNL